MSARLRSTQQELCRGNKSNLTASLSREKPLFHAAGCNRSSSSPIRSRFKQKKMLSLIAAKEQRLRMFFGWAKRGRVVFILDAYSSPLFGTAGCKALWQIISCLFLNRPWLHHKSQKHRQLTATQKYTENKPQNAGSENDTWNTRISCNISISSLKTKDNVCCEWANNGATILETHGNC